MKKRNSLAPSTGTRMDPSAASRARQASATSSRNIAVASASYRASKRWPDRMRTILMKGVAGQLPEGYDVETHFGPSYGPWDQRLCVVPDGDLFEGIKSGKASVVTDEIECFTEHGIQLRSGEHLDADIIIAFIVDFIADITVDTIVDCRSTPLSAPISTASSTPSSTSSSTSSSISSPTASSTAWPTSSSTD